MTQKCHFPVSGILLFSDFPQSFFFPFSGFLPLFLCLPFRHKYNAPSVIFCCVSGIRRPISNVFIGDPRAHIGNTSIYIIPVVLLLTAPVWESCPCIVGTSWSYSHNHFDWTLQVLWTLPESGWRLIMGTSNIYIKIHFINVSLNSFSVEVTWDKYLKDEAHTILSSFIGEKIRCSI